MSRSFGLVDYKVQEAEFFLSMMQDIGKSFRFQSMQFCASAFVSATRSITFAMQASLKGNERFDLWYKAKQEQLRQDRLAKFFHNFRTVAQHIGEQVVGGGSRRNGKTEYYFVPCPDLPDVPDDDVITACHAYYTSVLQLVFDCYIDLGPTIDGQQRYTTEYFASQGKTIEDAEAELGFPRGWTDIGDPESTPWRWELLRRQADGCLIEAQFAKWLGKSLPRAPRLPPRVTASNLLNFQCVTLRYPRLQPDTDCSSRPSSAFSANFV